MQFSANEWLVHPQLGVGRVVKLEMRQFGAGPRQQYYEIAIPTGTIWVPVEARGSGLRKLTGKGDLDTYRAVLRARPTPLAADHKERQIALAERMKHSSFRAKCEVVRDLAAHRWERPLNDSNANSLRNARLALCTEWAAAEGLTLVEATSEIEALLLEGRKSFGK